MSHSSGGHTAPGLLPCCPQGTERLHLPETRQPPFPQCSAQVHVPRIFSVTPPPCQPGDSVSFSLWGLTKLAVPSARPKAPLSPASPGFSTHMTHGCILSILSCSLSGAPGCLTLRHPTNTHPALLRVLVAPMWFLRKSCGFATPEAFL